MKKAEFVVESCNPSNSGKTFVWKLSVTTVATCFGVNKSVKRTYYIGGMPSEVAVGTKIEETVGNYEIVERPCYQKDLGNDVYETVEEGQPHDRVLMLKWLHVKVA